jgi:hypothetical protein
MIGQCISAVCTIVVVILAILIMTRAISLDDALKIAGKILVALAALYLAACLLGPPLVAGMNALALIFKTLIRWLVVAVLIAVPLMLLITALRRRFAARSNAEGSRSGGER